MTRAWPPEIPEEVVTTGSDPVRIATGHDSPASTVTSILTRLVCTFMFAKLAVFCPLLKMEKS